MAIQVLTSADLQQFKIELFNELKKLFKIQTSEPPKQWLKSYEVRNMLCISRGTLQTLRDNGTLKSAKIGGLIYYSYDDILKLMEGEKLTRENRDSSTQLKMQHSRKAYNGRSHTKKQDKPCKQKISFTVRKARDAKKKLEKLFPHLSYQLNNRSAKNIYQYSVSITKKLNSI